MSIRPKRKARNTVRRFRSTLEQSGNRIWGTHFTVAESIARDMCSRGRRRIVCTINGSEPIQRALLSQRNGKTVVTLNRPFMEKLKISIGSTVLVTMKSDDSRYGLPVPEELSEMFRQDSEGKLLFHGLTPGRQRTLLNLVGIVKKSDTRAWRAAVVTRHLKHHKGHIVYRLLYRELSRR